MTELCLDIARVKDKDWQLNKLVREELIRTNVMFNYEGLPDTIPKWELEKLLQIYGECIIAEHDGKLYALSGGFGGVLNEYYNPTVCTVANPHLKLNKMFALDKDCVWCRSDYLSVGLIPIIERGCSLLVENLISLRNASIMNRQQALISTLTDGGKQSADIWLKNLEDGKLASVVDKNSILAEDGGIKAQPLSTANNTITNLIELHQYIKGSMYNDLGLQSAYNMKRERLSEAESGLNSGALTPLIEQMLEMRKDFCEKVNKMYGTNISVDLASAWKVAETEEQATIEELEKGGGENENPEGL